QKQWLSSGKITLIERASMLLFGVGTFYLLVRVLNKADYGTWMLFISIHAFIDTARSGFLKNPLIKHLGSAEPNEQKEIQGSSLFLNLSFSIATALILLLIGLPLSKAWDAPDLYSLIVVNLVLSVVMAFYSHAEYVLNAFLKFKATLVGNLVRSASLFVFIAIYFGQEMKLQLLWVAYAFCLSFFLGYLAMLLCSSNSFTVRIKLLSSRMKALLGYGKYTLATNLSAVFMRNVDIWMIGIYINPVAVGVYNVAIRIANLFEVPTMALAQVLFPQAVLKANAEGDSALKDLYEKSVSLLVVLLFPLVIFVIIFSSWIVELLAGEGYAEAAVILNITMLYGLIVPFNKQLGILLDAIGKAKTNTLFVLRNAIINLVLNAIFIPFWGLKGAAFATLSTYVIAMVINQIYLAKNFNVSLKGMVNWGAYYVKHIPKLMFRKIG
ncbi:MAG: flippase, partial [Luteibaculum sp.]